MEDELWYGDLDLTKDLEELKAIQKDLEEPIVVTTEHGGFVVEISAEQEVWDDRWKK